jgi:hypothetical protein
MGDVSHRQLLWWFRSVVFQPGTLYFPASPRFSVAFAQRACWSTAAKRELCELLQPVQSAR